MSPRACQRACDPHNLFSRRETEDAAVDVVWRGRTARQDRPGQFYVVLDQKGKPFTEVKGLLDKVKKCTISSGDKKGEVDHDARVELLLENADEGIGDKLIAFEKEQAAGEKLNEVSVKYFKKNPRDFDDAWPQLESDKALRHFMTTMIEASPEEIKKEAKKQAKALKASESLAVLDKIVDSANNGDDWSADQADAIVAFAKELPSEQMVHLWNTVMATKNMGPIKALHTRIGDEIVGLIRKARELGKN